MAAPTRWLMGSALALAVLLAPAAAVAAEPVVVDIRTPAEWRATGVIEDALLSTFFAEDGAYDAARFVDGLAEQVDRNAPILLVCRTGNRTRVVMQLLEQAGFRRVEHVEGGIVRWLAQEKDVVVPAADQLPEATRFGRMWTCSGAGEGTPPACSSMPQG